MIQTTEEGGYKLHSFTDEHMERLYERFILEYYKYHHPELDPKAAQVKWNLSTQPNQAMIQFLPTMQTDITLQKNDNALIIDAKYYGRSLIQNYNKESFRSAHLYQIFTYVKNMDINNTGKVSGLLLYAKAHDESFPEGKPFIIGGSSIGVRSLDLNREFAEIMQQLENIVNSYFY